MVSTIIPWVCRCSTVPCVYINGGERCLFVKMGDWLKKSEQRLPGRLGTPFAMSRLFTSMDFLTFSPRLGDALELFGGRSLRAPSCRRWNSVSQAWEGIPCAGIGLILVATLCGCVQTEGVRYVYQDRDFGVVAMPENTDWWPTHYRRHGEKLMNDHFPDGYEIVRAEEVIEGEKTTKCEGSNSAEVSPQVSDSLLKVVKFGHSASHSEAETVKVKECRIIYRRTGAANLRDYAASTTLTPALYVDPNAAERRKATDPPQLKALAKVENKPPGR